MLFRNSLTVVFFFTSLPLRKLQSEVKANKCSKIKQHSIVLYEV